MEIHVSLMTVIFASLGGTCTLISGAIFCQVIGEVNRKLPDDQQISYWGLMHVDEATRIREEYKRLYPGGRLHHLRFIFAMAGFVLLLLATISAGFLPPFRSKQ